MLELERLSGGVDLSPIPYLEFSSDEKSSARWSILRSIWHGGYPQPEDTYNEGITISPEECPECRRGSRQVGPIRLLKMPKWGRRWLFSNHWMPYVLLAKRSVWEDRLQPLGIPSQPVLQHRTGEPFDDVVQLMPIAEVPVDTSELKEQQCPLCLGKWYEYPSEEFAPPPLVNASSALPALSQSNVWFDAWPGSKPLFASREFYDAVRDLEPRSITWHPCRSKA